MKFQKSLSLLFFIIMVLGLCIPSQAAEITATEISSQKLIIDSMGFPSFWQLFDKSHNAAVTVPAGSYLTLESDQGFGSLYILFDTEYGPCTITDNATNETHWVGQEQFLHAFWNLEELFDSAPVSITLTFPNEGAKISEMYIFTSGQVPDFVQKWSIPEAGKVDLMLFSTHGDDEQLFFAGLLPHYAGELNYEVLVVYLTSHRPHTNIRVHEMLNGLWAVGVTTYPVFGPFRDFYTKDPDKAYSYHSQIGETKENMLSFITEQLRHYKPLVTVGHDILNGEYHHGQHIMYAELLTEAVELAEDPDQFPRQAEEWGTWDVPKTYLHLWPENEIIMDWDKPLSRFDGLTAFQVTKHLGFPCHVTQKSVFSAYLSYWERASDMTYLSPCKYGLYRSTVGSDEGTGDFFENLTPYSQILSNEKK